ncbi:MAG: hypothetical protein CMJ78_01240 [Planctomycetaceae bacterium]|nr:hypothetical protein [Planctomycetaceae bacterium]
MNERQQQFRVGLFVIAASVVTAVMIFKFGDFSHLFDETYSISAHFDSAPGVEASAPVTMNGISVAQVREVIFDSKRGGVLVLINMSSKYRLRADTRVQLTRSILGDSTIELSPGKSKDLLPPDSMLEGELPVDPMQIVANLDRRLDQTLGSFDQTSKEWRQVAANLNSLMDTNRGSLSTVLERAAVSLDEFGKTMKTANMALSNANKTLADPQVQENLKRTVAALPKLTEETHQTVVAVKETISAAQKNLENLQGVTQPLSTHSKSIVVQLDGTLRNLHSLSIELNQFAKLANKKDGSLNQFASNPDLYQNLNQSAESLAILLKSLKPVVSDLQVFADKVARHPELIGVSGAIKGSSGIKEPSEARQANGPSRTRN